MQDLATTAAAIQSNPDWSGVRPVLLISRNLEIGLNVLMGLMLIACIYYAFRIARKERRPNAFYLLIGGTFAIFYEPLGDLVAHVTYHAGQINAISAFGFDIPTWMIPAYSLVAGTSITWMVDVIRSGVTWKKWWTLYGIMLVSAILFELPLVFLGAIEYYGQQSFTILGYPAWMAFMNCTGIIFVPGTIIYLLTEHGIIHRGNGFLLVPLVPLVVAGSHSAAGFIRGYIMNGGPHSQFEVEAVALLSMALAVLLTWVCGKVVTREA